MTDFEVISKSIAPATLKGTTGQFSFSEFSGTLGIGNVSYLLNLNDDTGGDRFYVQLDDSGTVTVISGLLAGWSLYSGAWTPNGGAHIVHFTIASDYTPRLWVDGSEIPLVFLGFGAGSGYDANAASISAFNLDGPGPPTKTSIFTDLFIATGNLPPSTVFCCPP